VKADVAAAGNSSVVLLPIDLSQVDGLPAKTEQALKLFGGVDVFINNAGFTQRELGANTDFTVDAHMLNVNYLSGVSITKALLPSMTARGGGRFICISSLAGKVGVPLRTAYCGSKHAMIGFFDALRAEEYARSSGVGVTTICPGSVRTNVARNAVQRSVGDLRGQSDNNIENGLDPTFVCDRILAAAHCSVDEVWIAGGMEMALFYLVQYLPSLAKKLVRDKAKRLIEDTLADVKG